MAIVFNSSKVARSSRHAGAGLGHWNIFIMGTTKHSRTSIFLHVYTYNNASSNWWLDITLCLFIDVLEVHGRFQTATLWKLFEPKGLL